MRFVTLALIVSVLSGSPACSDLAQPARQAAVTVVSTGVGQALRLNGTARVVVALRLPVASAALSTRKQQILQLQDRVIGALSPTGDLQLVRRFQTVPGMIGVITSAGLESLRHHPDVQAVALDMPVYATLTESAAVIRADRVWNELYLTGAGVNVAVLDTGIDRTHPDLAGHIVAQHCFNRASCPPNGTDEGDDAQDGNGHGTHVAGIVASRGLTSPRGIAPGTGIVAVRVMDETGSGWNSDLVAGIDWVVANSSRLNVKIINLSLGAGEYGDVCDTQDANTLVQASAVEAARKAGIIVFAASGNNGLADKMTAPACISGVVSVGGTYDANLGSMTWPGCADANAQVDQIVCFSNSSPALDLLAPGAVIVSTALGGGQIGKSGTSMASPHAAAVAALMLQAYPGLTPTEMESVLKSTGVPVTDRRNGRVTPRIDAFAAVTRVISDHVSASVSVSPASLQVGVGSAVMTSIQAGDLSNLYSVDLRLTFNPGVVQVLDADPATPGVQIAVGALMSGQNHSVVRNQADNTTGVIEFTATLIAPATPISSPGELAAITWQGRDAGQSALTLAGAKLAYPDGRPIPHVVRNGVIQVVPGAISGKVLLQGRTSYNGSGVYLIQQPCPSVSQTVAPGAPAVVTDGQGHFEIGSLPGSYQCLQVVRRGYLIGQKSVPQGDLGTITLPGGDVTGDDVVNVFDLALVGSRYGSNDPTADVNGDGVVNVFDLTLVGSNYGQVGPVADWH